jgi:hypothetical protein
MTFQCTNSDQLESEPVPHISQFLRLPTKVNYPIHVVAGFSLYSKNLKQNMHNSRSTQDQMKKPPTLCAESRKHQLASYTIWVYPYIHVYPLSSFSILFWFMYPIPASESSASLLALGHTDAFAAAALRGLEHHRETDALGAVEGLCGRGEARLPGLTRVMVAGWWWC